MRSRASARTAASLVVLAALVACGQGTQTPPPEEPLEPIVRQETLVLGTAARAALAEVRADGTLVFTGAGAPDLEPGSVVVTEPTTAAPFGLLRRVVAVSRDGAELVAATEQATLADALAQGSLTAEMELGPDDVLTATALVEGVMVHTGSPGQGSAALEDGIGLTLDRVLWDEDGDDKTKDDQVVFVGEIRFKPKFKMDLDIDCGGFLCTDPDLDFMFQLGMEEVARIGVTGEGKPGLSFEEKVPLATFDFGPQTFFVGPVPVVVTPKLVIELRFDGSLGVRVSYVASQTLTAVVGAKYDDGWHDISELDNDLSAGPVDAANVIQVEANARALGAVRGELMLYGVVGPTLEVSPWVRFDLRYPRDPVWRLVAGLTGNVGVRIDVLGIKKSYEKKLFEVSEEIARAGNTPPRVTIEGGPTAVAQVAAPFALSVSVQDAEDGPATCCEVTLRSSETADGDGGVIGAGTGPGMRVETTFATLGQRTVTATATDSHGATATATIVIDAQNTPPQVFSDQPYLGQTFYRGLPGKLRAGSFDPNEPGQALPCDALVWTSSDPEDPDPLGAGCVVDVEFGRSGLRLLTLTGTDSHGGQDTHTVSVNVLEPPDNLPPVTNILSPASGTVSPIEPLTLSGEAADPEGGEVVSMTWDLTRMYDPATGRGGQVLPVTPRADGTWAVADTVRAWATGCMIDERVRLRLRATDAEGAVGADFLVLRVMVTC